MNKVTLYDQGGPRADHLDDHPLQRGERVRVLWPDGSLTEETIRLVRKTVRQYDHGKYYDEPDFKAYIDVVYKGATVGIPLRGSELQLERLP